MSVSHYKESASGSGSFGHDRDMRELLSAIAWIENHLGRTIDEDDLKQMLAQVRGSPVEPSTSVVNVVERATAPVGASAEPSSMLVRDAVEIISSRLVGADLELVGEAPEMVAWTHPTLRRLEIRLAQDSSEMS